METNKKVEGEPGFMEKYGLWVLIAGIVVFIFIMKIILG
jgi:hypothetical protein